MSRKRRLFSSEFKQQVVQAVLSGSSQAAVARRYELSANTVLLWVKAYRGGRLGGEATADVQQLLAENRELKQLLGKLTLENEFLKRAEAFAADKKSGSTLLASGGPVSRSKKNVRS